MPIDWELIFDAYGEKRVTKTDKSKHAYVLNAAQKAALTAAKVDPSKGGGNDEDEIQVQVLFDPEVNVVNATYYNSIRKKDRKPETRMGREFVSWVNRGDRIIIGNIGKKIYAAKLIPELELTEAAAQLSKLMGQAEILKKAKLASGKPKKKDRLVKDYVRDPYVVAGALIRAGGICEWPECTHALFERKNGSPYLEVHHILPLSDGGDDTLLNVAALCPACHREHHFGALSATKRRDLAAHIAATEVPS